MEDAVKDYEERRCRTVVEFDGSILLTDVVTVLDEADCVYVRCSRWRRYTADGRFSKLTGAG